MPSRGRPPNPEPLIYWRLRIDAEPPAVCREAPRLAELLSWQIILVRTSTGLKGEAISQPLTGIRAYMIEDDGTKHRFLRRFGTAARPFHGYLIVENEPPANAHAILRVRGADIDPIADLPLADAERIDKHLFDQDAEQLARAALEREDVLVKLQEMLEARRTKPPKERPA